MPNFKDQVTLKDAGLVLLELRLKLDETYIQVWGKPTFVQRGVHGGFSLPIYAADNEELFFQICVPNRYDEASDPVVHIDCYLDTANTDKKFKLQMSWQHMSPDGEVVPGTSHDVEIETDTETAAQYLLFTLSFTIDYDIDTPDNIVADDIIGIRVRRIAASADEIAGEVVIVHAGIFFQRDKLGEPA